MSAVRLGLVGGQRVLATDGPVDEMLDFYGALFERLPVEVRHAGPLTRYVGYRCALDGKDVLHFLGIEVEQIEAVPAGMVAWTLNDDAWTVQQSQDGADVMIVQASLAWRWREPAPRFLGEFAVRLPAMPGLPPVSGEREFWLSAHAYVAPGAAAANDEVHLVPYDPSWPQQFADFAGWLKAELGDDFARRVEHYGSTAIPGMPAKPIIDVLVEVPSFVEARRRLLPLFNDVQWEYWWHAEHMVLIRRERLMGQRTHHVHVAPAGHRVWDGLGFRDYLRAHPQEAAAYAALKHELAAHWGQDRERYTEAKTAFVHEIAVKARGAQLCIHA